MIFWRRRGTGQSSPWGFIKDWFGFHGTPAAPGTPPFYGSVVVAPEYQGAVTLSKQYSGSVVITVEQSGSVVIE